MAISEWLRDGWSKVWRYFEALGWAADHDPREEQRRWLIQRGSASRRWKPNCLAPPTRAEQLCPTKVMVKMPNDPLLAVEKILSAKWSIRVLRVLADGPVRFVVTAPTGE